MQLFNGGARKIVLKDQVVEPKTLFEVTDAEGKKLMELYPEEVTKPPVAEKVASKNEIKKVEAERDEAIAERDKVIAELDEIKAKHDEAAAKIQELETQLADFEAIKAERDELKKAVDKLEAQIEKLKK